MKKRIFLSFMTLFTRCILSSRDLRDGLRISVMSRHTLEDGITPDPRIHHTLYDEWNRVLSAPAKFVGAYYRKEIDWKLFEKSYLEYLKEPVIAYHVENIARIAFSLPITLLCIEEKADRCHRRLLAEECQWHMPGLEVIHR
ncbi:MAG: hypothetical protein QT08_C0021G0008 [archaeon GW2011_AR17]|nr:MAG: hypothetical protein QT08_C0021G0008 [archaeon GW2011_AR17]